MSLRGPEGALVLIVAYFHLGAAIQEADLYGDTDTETWVILPRDQWPKHWHTGAKGDLRGYRNPVVRLRRALYGHPKAGLYWEQHCHQALTKCGFEKVKADRNFVVA